MVLRQSWPRVTLDPHARLIPCRWDIRPAPGVMFRPRGCGVKREWTCGGRDEEVAPGGYRISRRKARLCWTSQAGPVEVPSKVPSKGPAEQGGITEPSSHSPTAASGRERSARPGTSAQRRDSISYHGGRPQACTLDSVTLRDSLRMAFSGTATRHLVGLNAMRVALGQPGPSQGRVV